MKCALTFLFILGAVSTAYSQTTTYQVQLTGANQSPPVSTSATAQATISFNTASNNITYNFVFNGIPEPTAAHIHVNAGPGQNGSVGIPLWMAVFAPVPGAGPVNGLVASNTVMPPAFVGPLEVLPDYNNVNVSQVLSQYVQTGKAYVQVHNMEFPKGFVRGNFAESDIISSPVTPESSPVVTLPDPGSS